MAEESKDFDLNEEIDVAEISGSYAISKNYFNFEGIGPIESDIPVVDEVESFCSTMKSAFQVGKKALLNDMFNQIFNFFELYFPGKKLTLDCLIPPAEPSTTSMVVAPTKQVRRGDRITASKTKGTAAASSLPVMDLTNSEESNTFTFIHKRGHSTGPHDEALNAYSAELDMLKSNIQILASLPTGMGQNDVLGQLNRRLVKVIMEVSRLQQLQSEYFNRKQPRLGTPTTNSSSIHTPSTAGIVLAAGDSVRNLTYINPLGIMDPDPHATTLFDQEQVFHPRDNEDNDDDEEEAIRFSLNDA